MIIGPREVQTFEKWIWKMNPSETAMDVDEHPECKIEKSETKLPFSIENLLADKFDKASDVKEKVEDGQASTSAMGYFKNNTGDSEVNCETDEDDRESNQSSEHVDVEGSTVGDANDYLDEKRHDYQQSGMKIFFI